VYLYGINKQKVDKQNLISELINQAINKLGICEKKSSFMIQNKSRLVALNNKARLGIHMLTA
jgi:hypothetical protein